MRVRVLCLYCSLWLTITVQQLSSVTAHSHAHNKTFSFSLFNPRGDFTFSLVIQSPPRIPPFLSLSLPLSLLLPPPPHLSYLSELWQVCNWMINDHHSNPPPLSLFLSLLLNHADFILKWNCAMFMHTHTHIYAHRCAHFHTCSFCFNNLNRQIQEDESWNDGDVRSVVICIWRANTAPVLQ